MNRQITGESGPQQEAVIVRETKKKKRLSVLFIFNVVAAVFMLAPILIIVLVSFTPESTYSLPTTEWSLKWYREMLKFPRFFDAFQVSLLLAALSAFISVILGFLVAFAMTRYEFRGKGALDTLFLSPMTLPSVTVGFALLIYSTNLGLYNTFWSFLLVHIIITVPFVIKTIATSLAGIGKDMELAAMNLGASWKDAFLKVTIPLAKTGMIGAYLFAFLVSFGEVTIAIFIAGSKWLPLPLVMFNFMVDRNTPMIAAISTLLIVFAAILALIIDRFVGLKTVMTSSNS